MKNKILNLIFILLTLAGVAVSARLLFSGRSLWLDEGMLAWSVSNRSLGTLISKPLDLMQSAPVLYLYAVKLLTLAFGNSEVTLRLFSFISYIAVIVLTYFLSERLCVKRPYAVCACVSGCGILLRYSCEFKPYMTDCAAVLGVLLLYSLYNSKKVNFAVLTAVYAFMVWLSNPACIFIAAIFIFELLKNIKSPLKTAVGGMVIALSFVLYYVLWLNPVIAKGDMTAYWENMKFPILITSKAELKNAFDMLMLLAKPVGIISLIALFCVSKIKKPEISVIFIGFALCFIASSLGFFPISERIWLFSYPILIILSFVFFSLRGIAEVVVSLALIFSVSGIYDYKSPESVYIEGDNLNPIVDYLKDKDEFTYVYVHSVPTYCYRMNYEVPDNVMLGNGYFEEYNSDIEEIKAHNSGYIVVSHRIGNRVDGLFEALENDFAVTEEFSDHGTILYHFQKNDDAQ